MPKFVAAVALAIAIVALFGFSALALRQTAGRNHSASLIAARIQARLHQRRSEAVKSSGEDVKLAGLDVSVWTPDRSGPAPLIVFSHGFHGSSRQSVFLMDALSKDGYLVVAPNHRDAIRQGGGPIQPPEQRFSNAAAWSDATFKDRDEDIKSLIGALKADSRWSQRIDWSKVALVGHSLGGYTALGLAGAWPSWQLSGVKAVVALSPYAAPFINKKTLGGIHVPVMYQGGTLDAGISPFVKKQGGAYDQTPSPAYYVEFRGAGHLAWTDLRPQFQDDIVRYTEAFLDKYVKGASDADPTVKLSDVSELRAK